MSADRDDPTALTTMHFRSARDGDTASLNWLVERLAPLLLSHAEYRLGPQLRQVLDPHDLVQEAWAATLPKLGELNPRDGRFTPVLLKYLTTTITYRVARALRKKPEAPIAHPDDRARTAPGVVTRITMDEDNATALRLLQELPDSDREVILLRGVESLPAKTVAELLGVSAPAIDKRYARALERLRRRLPASVFTELEP